MSTMTVSSTTLSSRTTGSRAASSAAHRTAPTPVRLRVVRPGEAAPATATRTAARTAPRRVRGTAQVRLTRRGRLSVFLASLVAVLSLGVALGAGSVATEEPGTPTPTRTVVVGPGDTLWGIAGELAGDGEVRAMVDRIERLNALDSALVQAGQRLRVPLTE